MEKSSKLKIAKFIPLLVLVTGIIGFVYFRGYEYLNFHTLKQHHSDLIQWRTQHFLIAPLLFIGIYTVLVAFSIPQAALLSIIGGYLFGVIEGTVYAVISATLGACILFLSVKTAFGSWMSHQATPWIKRFKKGFQKNAFNYLLILRLIPLFPFWVINVVPALLGVPFRTYVSATFLGIIPATFIYVSLGSGLEDILRTHQSFDLKIFSDPKLFLPLLALAFLALVPILYQKIKGK